MLKSGKAGGVCGIQVEMVKAKGIHSGAVAERQF